jgi:hypothetical protein
VGYQRDPLSPRFDAAAAKFVTRALAANGRWVETAVAPPTERLIRWALARGFDPLRIRYTGRGSGIESQYEAAFRRAVYWDHRVYLWARPSRRVDGQRVYNPERVCAVEFRWARRTSVGRVARIRVFRVDAATGQLARAAGQSAMLRHTA